MSLQTIVDADECGACAAIALGEIDDLRRGNSGYLADALGGVFRSTSAQRVFSESVTREIVPVLEATREEHVHDPQRERCIGTRTDCDPFVALCRGSRAQWVDGDDPSTALARLENEGPEV